MKKHIYKYSLENEFFKLITSDNLIYKHIRKGSPAIEWTDTDGSVYTWVYDSIPQRNHDYDVVNEYKKKING